MKKISYLKVLTLIAFSLALSSHTPSLGNLNSCTKKFWIMVHVEEIAENISDPNYVCNNKRIIHMAAKYSSTEVFAELLRMGANPNSRDNHGQTPLMWAAWNKNTDVVNALVNAGADVNAENENGATPLIYAAEKGHAPMAKMLIDAGADVNAMDNKKRTALFWAKRRKHMDVVRILKDAGAAEYLSPDQGGQLNWSCTSPSPLGCSGISLPDQVQRTTDVSSHSSPSETTRF